MRRAGLWVMLGLLCAPLVRAAPACAEATAVARAFHQATVDGGLLVPPPTLVSAAFAQALSGERDCQEREQGICTIDADPWLDAQDGDIEGAVEFSWSPTSPTAGVVEVRYRVWGEPYRTRLPMVRQGPGCWQVDDVITNSGRSVRQILAQPLP